MRVRRISLFFIATTFEQMRHMGACVYIGSPRSLRFHAVAVFWSLDATSVGSACVAFDLFSLASFICSSVTTCARQRTRPPPSKETGWLTGGFTLSVLFRYRANAPRGQDQWVRPLLSSSVFGRRRGGKQTNSSIYWGRKNTLPCLLAFNSRSGWSIYWYSR